MKMIIGGAYQGKLAYAKKQNPYIHWTDGELCEGDNIFEAEGVFHFEKYIQSMIKKENWSEKEAIDFASKLTKKCPDIVIVTQEIGYGLVPVDAFDRSFFLTLFYSFGVSFFVECFQLVTRVGSFDVDDMLLNTFGGVIGYIVFAICNMIRRWHDAKQER